MLPLSAVCRKVFPPLEKCCSLGPVSSSHSLFRPPLVILTGIINAAASLASASFPPTQQSVSLEMRRRAWRKSGRLIRPPPSPQLQTLPIPHPLPPLLFVCGVGGAATIYRMDQQQYRLVSIHEPSGCSLLSVHHHFSAGKRSRCSWVKASHFHLDLSQECFFFSPD